MVKISLADRKFVVLIGALLSSALAFVILRALLTNPGLIEAIDIQWNQNFAMFEYLFHTWNFYTNGSNIVFASQFPVYGWVLVFRDVALAQRFVYFLTVSLVSFNMFIVAFYTLKKTVEKTLEIYFGSIVASLVYVLSPLMISELFHISFLWAYSLFPLVFYFGWESFNTSSRRKVLVSSILLSIFFAFMADAWGMVVGLVILGIVAVSSVVLNGRKNLVHRFIPNFLLTLLIMGIVTILLASYWLLPYLTQGASEPVWDPFSHAILESNSGNQLSIIFGLHSWPYQPFFSNGTNPVFYNIWQGATIFLPIVAAFTILLRRNKLTLTLSGLLLVGFFLGKGTQDPLGGFYSWLVFPSIKIISVQSFLLKYPYLFLAIASLSVALLSSFLVAEVFKRVNFNLTLKRFSVKSHALPIVLFFSIISLIALVGAPLLTGNLNGALSPVTLPDQYKELNGFFSSQNGSFRVMYVPQEANFDWSTNPWANKIEYWGSGATPLMYGWGISASPNTGFLGNLVYDYLLTNQTQYLGKLLALGNVRYIVFHNDSESGDPAAAFQAFELYFKQYKAYFNSFLSSDEYNYYFLSVNKTTGGTDDGGYLNFILKQEYLENYQNSSEYQNFLNSSNLKLIDFSNNLGLNSTENIINLSKVNKQIEDDNSTALKEYLDNYQNSSIYKNLPNSRVYLSNSLNSQAYQSYLKDSPKEYQNFIDSPIYNNSHNYLDSIEYLILTGSQYFANSTDNRDFINSVEYKAFLNYYLLYTSNEYPELAKAANEKYGASYQNFQNSLEYTKYQTYLNYHRSNYPEMFNNLQAQKDLKLVPFSNDNLFVFENTEMMNYFQAFSKANLVVGGLDTVGSLSSIGDFYLNDSAFLFVENQQMSESNLASILNSPDLDKNLLFYDSKTFDDLVLDTIDTGDYVVPGEIFVNTSTDWWLSNAVTSYSWTPIALSNYMGEKYDFGLGHNLLYTTNVGATFDLPVEIGRSDEYSIWLRLLFSPGGGNMTFSIDNSNDTITFNTATSVLNGFNWVNISNVSLTNGSHSLRVISEGGLNAVNLAAFPTVFELAEHSENLNNLINQSNAKVVYTMDKTFLSSTENNGTVSIFAPYPASYKISFQTKQPLPLNALTLILDNKEQSVFSTNSFSDTKNWYSAGPFNLSKGYHYIDFSSLNIETAIVYSVNNTNSSMESLNSILGGGAEPYVVSYEKSDPVSFSVVVNASKGFVLGFQEPYDGLWKSNISSTKLFLNAVNNGFIVDSNGTIATVVNITYSPEESLQLGLKISLISFLASLMTICLVLVYPKIRQKSAVQKTF